MSNTTVDSYDYESSMILACYRQAGSTYKEWLADHPEAWSAKDVSGFRLGPSRAWDRLRQLGHIEKTGELRKRSIVYRVSSDIEGLLELHEAAGHG